MEWERFGEKIIESWWRLDTRKKKKRITCSIKESDWRDDRFREKKKTKLKKKNGRKKEKNTSDSCGNVKAASFHVK